MDADGIIQLLILMVLLMLSAFFSSCETALTMVNKVRLRTLADDGDKTAALVLDMAENKTSKMLSAILIGNNIVNISASALATTLAYRVGGYMISLVTALLTILILIFGEVTPKNYATINAEKISLRYGRIIYGFMVITTPAIFVLNFICRRVLRLLGVDLDSKNPAMTEEELRTIVDVSHEDGVIESDEKEMIYNVFDFEDVKARDIMVPRVHVTFADVDSTYEELLEIYQEEKYTRLPVYEENQDNIVGIINMKDLLLYDKYRPFHVRDIMREPHFTYEYRGVSELLGEMRSGAFNITVVLNEYGEVAGLVTLEDILEEIVGEIRDEFDEDEEDKVSQLSEREYIVDGAMSLDDVNDRLNTGLTSEDYDSLGGYVIEHLGRFPEAGDEISTEDGTRLRVEKLNKNHIERIYVSLPENAEEEEASKEEQPD